MFALLLTVLLVDQLFHVWRSEAQPRPELMVIRRTEKFRLYPLKNKVRAWPMGFVAEVGTLRSGNIDGGFICGRHHVLLIFSSQGKKLESFG